MSGVLGGLIGSSGKTWKVLTFADSAYHHALTSFNGLSGGGGFIMLKSAGSSTASNQYRYSNDGITWTDGTHVTSAERRVLLASPTLVLAAGTQGSLGMASSSTGLTGSWTEATSSGTNAIDGLWDGTRFIIADSSTTAGIHYSTNGTTWQNYDVGNGALSIDWDKVSTYIVVQNATTNTGRLTTSITNSASWTNITFPSSQLWNSIKHNGSIWVAAANNSTTYATSTNGTAWTFRTLPATFTGSGVTASRARMGVIGNKFYYLNSSSTTSSTIYSSVDGINWIIEQDFTSLPAATNARIATDWASFNGNIVVSLGGNGGGLVNDYFLFS